MRSAAFLLLLVTSFAVEAQVYRWIDEKGTVHYSSEKPPAGTRATVLDIDTKPGKASPDSKDCYSLRCQGERMEQRIVRREETEVRVQAQQLPAPPKPRGLTFSNYVSLQRGMTESELVVRAGPPDMQFRDRHIRTYTYLPTVADPFTTVVTVNSGRISEIERIRKF